MTPENKEATPKIDLDELRKKGELVLVAIASKVFAVERLVQNKLGFLTFEEHVLARYDQMLHLGLTEKQSVEILYRLVDNVLAGRDTNKKEDRRD